MSRLRKVIQIDISQPLQDLSGLEDFDALRGLVRVQGQPLGWVEVAIEGGVCRARAIATAILAQFRSAIVAELLEPLLTAGTAPGSPWEAIAQGRLPITALLTPQDLPAGETLPPITVALCNLSNLSASPAEVESCAAHLVALQQQYPALDWFCLAAEAGAADGMSLYNQAIAQSQSDLLVFLQPHLRLDLQGLQAIAQGFRTTPELAAMTGLVIPAEQATEALLRQERHGLLPQNLERRWQRRSQQPERLWQQVQLKTWLNPDCFVVRRSALGTLRLRPELGSEAGAIAALCFELLQADYTILAEPRLILQSWAAQDEESLRSQLRQQMAALAQYYLWGWRTGSAQLPRAYGKAFLREGLGGFYWAIRSWLSNQGEGRRLHGTEIAGWIQGLRAGWTQGPTAATPDPSKGLATDLPPSIRVGVRHLDLAQPLTPLTDLDSDDRLRLFISHHGQLLDSLELENCRGTVSVDQLRRALFEQLGQRLLTPPYTAQHRWEAIATELDEQLLPPEPEPEAVAAIADVAIAPVLPETVKVSIVITTCDRPADLRHCLTHLLAQQTQRPLEIIVADNRPASGLTPPVVAEFSGVRLVSEPRVGGSYGRNTACCASTGEIIVTIDDDVTVPADWLEKLIAPMARPEVMVVTGNVLPKTLETEAQRLYEDLYGGLSEGFEPFEADGAWLSSYSYSPPVWDLGVSANSAFRATVFSHPDIGLMPEILGPGTPVGGGEENYLIYKILKAGYRLVYQPSAFVWHRHRRTIPELRYQIYRQMMGGTAYHLMLWLVDGDRRGRTQLLQSLPQYFKQRWIDRLKHRHAVPWSFLLAEVSGYLGGFWGYWRSHQAVQRQGRSAPYIPVAEREAIAPAPTEDSSPSPSLVTH